LRIYNYPELILKKNNLIQEAVFPIVTFNPINKEWKCLGTGYFINPKGAFATAKHLFMNSDKKTEPTLYGIQKVSDDEYHVRPISKLIAHGNADIMIGTLGPRRLPNNNLKPADSKYFKLDLNKLDNGDLISTYAYPNSKREQLQNNSYEFTFQGDYATGKIIDFHERSPVVENRCYQTNMRMESGASGGPVLKDNHIVGVNSSSFTLIEGEEPISYITPIDFILDLSVYENKRIISVNELIKNQ
jgi:V8-like Glu-specific endopeptidase